jgi:Holliday junction DNA helicase RuvA
MIARVRGMVLEKGAESVVVEAGGVGYEIFVTSRTLAALPPVGAEAGLHTHFHVREDAQILFGFLQPEERQVFLLLMTVKGVGPKVALGILSHLETGALARALESRDLAALTALPGVGKKLAERLAVELSDKIKTLGLALAPLPAGSAPAGGVWEQALAALMALGFPQAQARTAVDGARKRLGAGSHGLETIVKEALRAV